MQPRCNLVPGSFLYGNEVARFVFRSYLANIIHTMFVPHLSLLKDGDHKVAANTRPLSMLKVLSIICEN